MKHIIVFFLLISVTGANQLYAQQLAPISFDKNYEIKIYRSNPEKFEGTPFYNDEWAMGYVVFNSGKSSKDTDLKFSSYTNQVIFKKNNQLLAVSPETYTGFVLNIDDDSISFKKGFESAEHDISQDMLLEVIHDGTVKLLTYHEKKIFERTTDPLTGEVTKSFNSLTTSFFVDKSGTFHEIDLESDDILDVVSSGQDKLEKYAEDNDLDFDDKSDLKKIFNRYEEMAKTSQN